jgi:prepilin-type N-terminal cleavage/methylation domain-containing protein
MLTGFRTKTNEKGFTLIELMIVVAIIGVLAGLAVGQFISYRTRSYNTMVESDLRNAASAQEAYYTSHEIYSTNVANLPGFTLSQGVHIAVNGTSSKVYTMAAYHNVGNATYTLIGPGGAMTKN